MAAVIGCASAQPKREDTAPAQSAATAAPKDAATAAADASPTPLERFLANVDTLTADFEQRVYSTAGNLTDRSTGTMAIDRPGKFRWHYAPPDEYLILTDGTSLKTYEFDLEHLTNYPLEDASADPLSLLSGDSDFDDVFDVVDRYDADGLDWIKLEPIGGAAGISALAIGFDGDLPRRIEYVDSTDERIRIDLTNLAVDTELPAELFEFEPPEGATVLGGA